MRGPPTDTYPPNNTYAIGNADSIGAITNGYVNTLEYDLKQCHEEDAIVYMEVRRNGRRVWHETDPTGVGDHFTVKLAEHYIEEYDGAVYGFVVPDHLLATFFEEFPDMEILRQ